MMIACPDCWNLSLLGAHAESHRLRKVQSGAALSGPTTSFPKRWQTGLFSWYPIKIAGQLGVLFATRSEM